MTAQIALLAVVLAAPSVARGATAEEETADGVMAKVAENQQRAVEMRRAFVYRQNVLVRLKRGNGKLAREEIRDLTITPTDKGFERKLDHFEGKYEKNGSYVEYFKPGYTYRESDIDGELASDLADDLTAERGSRDGIANSLFPLTPERQKQYTFKLEGRQEFQGRDVFRVIFNPRRNLESGTCWAGEVLVDTHEYQPVLVTTHLSCRVPLWVRVAFGTNLRYLGFKLSYEKFAEGVWFPVRYGGEFDMRVLFVYRRRIAISAINSGFQRTEVDSRVTYADTR